MNKILTLLGDNMPYMLFEQLFLECLPEDTITQIVKL